MRKEKFDLFGFWPYLIELFYMVKISKAQNAALEKVNSQAWDYTRFRKIDGRHPLQTSVEDFAVLYKTRQRPGGKLAFFNFDFAKELGLIPKDHPEEMSEQLEEAIFYSFGIIIINEYDVENKVKIPEESIHQYPSMATRYLQMQHPDKRGSSSGDGRSIWNGTIKAEGKFWDISSCGTGATKLSPACNINNKFYQSGDPSISYGCGMSELDEGLETAFFSEILHKNNLCTERVLAIIEYPSKLAITVRAHPNLLRPSHFFRYLKLGNVRGATQVLEYYIDRQEKNGVYKDVPKNKKERYQYFLKKVCDDFARVTAQFEDEYIFCWMDWDGDNILMDGGIIDYGSVRQFGLFHHEYRYDDIERYSTTITEQKSKARYIVQTFAQYVSFVITGKKKSINSFKRHPELTRFDRLFEEYKDKNLLKKIGLSCQQSEYIFKHHHKLIKEFRKDFKYFERMKSKNGPYKVTDGITWDAVFCVRDVLRELPQMLLRRHEMIGAEEFLEVAKSNYATAADVKVTQYKKDKINSFGHLYLEIIRACAQHENLEQEKILLEVVMRSSVINKYDRITGDSITTIIQKLINSRPKIRPDQMYNILQNFASYQTLIPEKKVRSEKKSFDPILNKMFKIVRDFREGL